MNLIISTLVLYDSKFFYLFFIVSISLLRTSVFPCISGVFIFVSLLKSSSDNSKMWVFLALVTVHCIYSQESVRYSCFGLFVCFWYIILSCILGILDTMLWDCGICLSPLENVDLVVSGANKPSCAQIAQSGLCSPGSGSTQGFKAFAVLFGSAQHVCHLAASLRCGWQFLLWFRPYSLCYISSPMQLEAEPGTWPGWYTDEESFSPGHLPENFPILTGSQKSVFLAVWLEICVPPRYLTPSTGITLGAKQWDKDKR